MFLIEITDIRSGHRGQVTKGQHMNPNSILPCDACFKANFSLPAQLHWLDDHQIRFRLLSGGVQVKTRLRSGQISQNFEADIFA